MTNPISHAVKTHRHLLRAQDCLLDWASERAESLLGPGANNMGPLNILLPEHRQIMLVIDEADVMPTVLIFCGLGHGVQHWHHGGPATLMSWLCEGMLSSPRSIACDARLNCLVIAITPTSNDWDQASDRVLPRIDGLIDYLTRVRRYLFALDALPSLVCAEALRLQARFQADICAIPETPGALAQSFDAPRSKH